MNFVLGEQKEVGIEIKNRKNKPFIIDNASYELKMFGRNIIESSGTATVDNESKEITAIINPLEKGTYILTFIYEVYQEILKAEVQIAVR